MASTEPAGSADPVGTALTLEVRRAGHAAMRVLLDEMDRRSLTGTVPADLLPRHAVALGEVLVGQELALLPAGWRVLHAVPVGAASAIDHLVIGPPGVFVLSTRRHRDERVAVGADALWIGGVRIDGAQQRLQQRAGRVRRLLDAGLPADAAVQPLLVVVDAAEVRTRGPQTVASVRASRLVAHLTALPPVLAPEAVHDLVALARRPGTWGRSASVLHEPDPTQRFLRLAAPAPGRVPPSLDERMPPPAPRPPVRRSRSGTARGCSAPPAPAASTLLTLATTAAAAWFGLSVLAAGVAALTGG